MSKFRPRELRTAWQIRRDYLLKPFFKGLGGYVAGFAAATALVRPWGLLYLWSLGGSVLGTLALCAWLWRPWVVISNAGRQSRFSALVFVAVLGIALGCSVSALLHARLGEVRDLRSVAQLAQPGEALYFRLHNRFSSPPAYRGEFADTSHTESKGKKSYYAECYCAYPLLASAADTSRPAAGWLGYSESVKLGTSLPTSEQQRLSSAFFNHCDSSFAKLTVRFEYLRREENPPDGLYRAVQASRLQPSSQLDDPQLYSPLTTPFSQRGWSDLKLVLGIGLCGSAFFTFMLLTLNLRPAAEWPA